MTRGPAPPLGGPACPSCGSTDAATVLYGMPDPTPELREGLDSGKIVLGGCCVTDGNPELRCNECGEGFSRRDRRP